jgi:hypothetical protein
MIISYTIKGFWHVLPYHGGLFSFFLTKSRYNHKLLNVEDFSISIDSNFILHECSILKLMKSLINWWQLKVLFEGNDKVQFLVCDQPWYNMLWIFYYLGALVSSIVVRLNNQSNSLDFVFSRYNSLIDRDMIE